MPDVTQSELQFAGCPLCEAGTSLDPLYTFDRGFGYKVCRECGLYILSPRLPFDRAREYYRSGEYYQSGNHDIGYAAYERDAPCHRRTFRKRLEMVRKFHPGGKLLDVGCGYGYLLEEARNMGYDCFGVDVSPEAVARARKLPGHEDRIWEGTIETVRASGLTVDVICMTDLFEHIYEPRDFLGVCAELLNPGGILFLVTPDTGSLLRRFSGRHWVSLKVPEHVYLYNKQNLSRALSPRFKMVATFRAKQYGYGYFLFERLAALHPIARVAVRTVQYVFPALDRKMFYVTSGSIIVLARKE